MNKPRNNSEGEAGPTFEKALRELQQIVRDLEDGALGLEESMQRFEAGVALLRGCFRTLEQAEQKIQILTGMNPETGPITAPFDATSTMDQSKPPPTSRGSKSAGVKRPSNQEPSACSDDGDSEATLF